MQLVVFTVRNHMSLGVTVTISSILNILHQTGEHGEITQIRFLLNDTQMWDSPFPAESKREMMIVVTQYVRTSSN